MVGITGPRQSGKTTLARSLFSDKPYVSLENPDDRNYALDDPRGFLGQYPAGAVLDEVQRCPQLFSYIQGIVDDTKKPGMFILTGSQQFGLMAHITQSLAGRVGILNLLPFSYSELREGGVAPQRVEDVVLRGGYPALYDQPVDPTNWLNSYITTYIERDVRQLVNIRDLELFRRFVELCAGSVGQLTDATRLGADCGVSRNTIQAWLDILDASFILFRLQPHHDNLRKRLVKTPKFYFYDVGLAARLLGIESAEQLWKHPLRGALFENWVIAEFVKSLRNNADTRRLYFWRDRSGHELDVLIERGLLNDVIEIKSGKTIASDWLKTLTWWKNTAQEKSGKRHLVYAGDTTQKRHDVEIVPWNHIDSVLRTRS